MQYNHIIYDSSQKLCNNVPKVVFLIKTKKKQKYFYDEPNRSATKNKHEEMIMLIIQMITKAIQTFCYYFF